MIKHLDLVNYTKHQYTQFIRTLFNGCVICNQARSFPEKSINYSSILDSDEYGKFERIIIDIHEIREENGYKMVLSIMDMFSRYKMFVPLRTKRSVEVIQALLNNWIYQFGVPLVIFSDQGAEFESNIMGEFCTRLGVRQLFCAPHSPWQRGAIERIHRDLNEILRSLPNGVSWNEALPSIQYAMNSSYHRAVAMTPEEIVFGESTRKFWDVRQENLDNPSNGNYFGYKFGQMDQIFAVVRSRVNEYNSAYVSKYLEKLNKNRHNINLNLSDYVDKLVLVYRPTSRHASSTVQWKLAKLKSRHPDTDTNWVVRVRGAEEDIVVSDAHIKILNDYYEREAVEALDLRFHENRSYVDENNSVSS